VGRLMSPDDAAGHLTLASGFVAACLAVAWLAWDWHAVWAVPVAAVGVALVCLGLRRLRNLR